MSMCTLSLLWYGVEEKNILLGTIMTSLPCRELIWLIHSCLAHIQALSNESYQIACNCHNGSPLAFSFLHHHLQFYIHFLVSSLSYTHTHTHLFSLDTFPLSIGENPLRPGGVLSMIAFIPEMKSRWQFINSSLHYSQWVIANTHTHQNLLNHLI